MNGFIALNVRLCGYRVPNHRRRGRKHIGKQTAAEKRSAARANRYIVPYGYRQLAFGRDVRAESRIVRRLVVTEPRIAHLLERQLFGQVVKHALVERAYPVDKRLYQLLELRRRGFALLLVRVIPFAVVVDYFCAFTNALYALSSIAAQSASDMFAPPVASIAATPCVKTMSMI